MTKITFIADTHHFSKTLVPNMGRAFRLRNDSDQKCLIETGAIIDSAFEYLKGTDTRAIFIAGDVSNDGERASHNEFKEKLYDLQKSKPVYVITATHDWCCDGNPRLFDGDKVSNDVETVPHEELRDFYADFGPNRADSEFITHLGTCSFTVDVGGDVRVLCLNDDQNGMGAAGFSEEHFRWIEARIKKAEADGRTMIGMEHHLLIAHVHPFVTGGTTCVGSRDMVASRLADAGLKYMFVGHSHMQAVDKFTSEKGNTITEVNVGALVGYPAPIVNTFIENGTVRIETEYLKSFEYEGKTYDAKEYLAKHACGLIDSIINCGNADKKEFSDRLSALGINGKSNKTISNFFPVIKPLLKLLLNKNTARAYKILHGLCLVPKSVKPSFDALAEKPIMDYVHFVMLSLWDGQIGRVEEGSDFYNVLMSVLSIPKKFTKAKIADDIIGVGKAVLLGNGFNVENCVLSD